MKKVIEDLALTFGCSTTYAGGRRIMYVKGERSTEFIRHAREKYSNLAFDLKISELSLQVFTDSEVNENLIKKITNGYWAVEETNILEKSLAIKIADEHPESFIALDKEINKVDLEILRDKVDIYLLANPIDKSQKGFFIPIAEKFGCTSDYIRKRYNSLNKRGLIIEHLNF